MYVLILGDIHGELGSVKANIRNKDIENCAIIQVGDFGIGFRSQHEENERCEDLNKFLAERGIIMYAIRGNHDDPSYFDGSKQWSNLKLLPDYTVLDIEGDSYFLVGGALSIDRKMRLAEMTEMAKYNIDKKNYWYDENFVLDKKKAEQIKGCRYVITHTSPKFCYPDNRNGFGQLVEHFIKMGDPKLRYQLTEEREQVTKLYKILLKNNQIEKWYYGHFHSSKLTEHNGTDFHLVGIHEFKEVR